MDGVFFARGGDQERLDTCLLHILQVGTQQAFRGETVSTHFILF